MPFTPVLGGDANQQIDDYIGSIQQNIQAQQGYLENINQKNTELVNKQNIQIAQLKEIQDKEKLLLTRSRMLQIAQDRNSYKKKIIYTLLAIIFGIFILILVIYVLFTRKLATQK
jgi:predicted PurR-regulated permease PerM